jgi:hypothetical protein
MFLRVSPLRIAWRQTRHISSSTRLFDSKKNALAGQSQVPENLVNVWDPLNTAKQTEEIGHRLLRATSVDEVLQSLEQDQEYFEHGLNREGLEKLFQDFRENQSVPMLAEKFGLDPQGLKELLQMKELEQKEEVAERKFMEIMKRKMDEWLGTDNFRSVVDECNMNFEKGKELIQEFFKSSYQELFSGNEAFLNKLSRGSLFSEEEEQDLKENLSKLSQDEQKALLHKTVKEKLLALSETERTFFIMYKFEEMTTVEPKNQEQANIQNQVRTKLNELWNEQDPNLIEQVELDNSQTAQAREEQLDKDAEAFLQKANEKFIEWSKEDKEFSDAENDYTSASKMACASEFQLNVKGNPIDFLLDQKKVKKSEERLLQEGEKILKKMGIE